MLVKRAVLLLLAAPFLVATEYMVADVALFGENAGFRSPQGRFPEKVSSLAKADFRKISTGNWKSHLHT